MNKQQVLEDIEELLRSARIFRNESRYAEAIMELERALELSEKFKITAEKTQTLSMLANIQHELGNTAASLSSYNDALTIAEQESKPEQIAHINRHIADVEREIGSLKTSLSHYQKALQYYKSNVQAHTLNRAKALRGLALLKEKMVDYSDAKRLWKEARSLYEKVKIEEGVSECVLRLKILSLK